MAHRGAIKSFYRLRRTHVGVLRRYGPPSPVGETKRILRGLAAADVFRLGASVVATVAYHTYAAFWLSNFQRVGMQTADLNLARLFPKNRKAIDDEVLVLVRDDRDLRGATSALRRTSLGRSRAPISCYADSMRLM
jgi:hypothetical protein